MLDAFRYYGENIPFLMDLYLPKAYKDRLIEAIIVTSNIELLEYTLLNNTFVKTKQTLVIDGRHLNNQSYFINHLSGNITLSKGILIQKIIFTYICIQSFN